MVTTAGTSGEESAVSAGHGGPQPSGQAVELEYGASQHTEEWSQKMQQRDLGPHDLDPGPLTLLTLGLSPDSSSALQCDAPIRLFVCCHRQVK